MARLSIPEILGGQTRFGRLTVIGEGEPRPYKSGVTRRALCRCDCGAERLVEPAKLRRGTNLSCGCLSAENSVARGVHNGWQEPEYRSWQAMIDRCTNPKHKNFDRYGGRGIAVDPSWRGEAGYVTFRAALGPRPAGTTLERIDNEGGYFPGNVRWATKTEQARNKSSNRKVEFNGVMMTITEAADRSGVSRHTLAWRIDNGWHPSRLFERAR